VRWHSEALPPTELFIDNGLGWFTGSRDSDCFRLACRLWHQCGGEAAVVAFIYEAWKRTQPKDHPFTWQDAHHKIKQAERYWRAEVEANRRLAGLLMRWSLMTSSKYADEEAAAEESANHTCFEGEIRIRARERALQLIRDEEAVGFAAEFESKIVDAAHIETPDLQPYLVKKLIYLPGVTMLHSDPACDSKPMPSSFAILQRQSRHLKCWQSAQLNRFRSAGFAISW
jgi:hypothetical protein